jgi:hypothetical protein
MFFYGYCFFCSNFGHKAVNCSLKLNYEQSRHSRYRYLPQKRMRQPSNKPPQTANHLIDGKRTQVKHNNRYDPLSTNQKVTSVITIDINLLSVA